MGYRSVVAAAITVDRQYVQGTDWEDRQYDKEKFKEVVGKLKLLITNEYLLNSIGWKNGVITLYIDWVKWYDDYEEVQQWDTFWHAVQQEAGISGVFVRIGEETDDIQQDSFGEDPVYDLCEVTRGVSIDPINVKETEDAQEQTEQVA